jgi:hypothetical protein
MKIWILFRVEKDEVIIKAEFKQEHARNTNFDF